MKNPHTSVVEMSRIKWMMKYHKGSIFAFMAFGLFAAIFPWFMEPDLKWQIPVSIFGGIVAAGGWLRSLWIHKKNVEAYNEWEIKHGEK